MHCWILQSYLLWKCCVNTGCAGQHFYVKPKQCNIIIIITVVASSCFIEEGDLLETISGKVQQGLNWIQGIHCT